MMQTAVMGTKYRSGFHFIFDLRINLDMISQVPAGAALTEGARGDGPYLKNMFSDVCVHTHFRALSDDSDLVTLVRTR